MIDSVTSVTKLLCGWSHWNDGSRRVFKMHYQVTVEDRRQVEIFRNMKTGSWYCLSEP